MQLTSIHLGRGIDQKAAGALIAQAANSDLADQTYISADEFSSNLVVDPIALQFASVLLSLISVLIALRRETRELDARDTWSGERFETLVKDEMYKLGVANFEITCIQNFSAMHHGGACQVKISNKATNEIETFEIKSTNSGYEFSKID